MPDLPKAVAIIPVRGGSRGIPRKNARLMAGKPLMAHAIEAARAAGTIDRVFVSTDDDELAEIARRFGAEVMERPLALAGDAVGLDAVIADAAGRLAEAGVEAELVVTLQATCPLTLAATIDAVVEKCVGEGLDTVLTVVNDAGLAWTRNAAGEIVPVYTERVNRQWLAPYLKETGGVVVCTLSGLLLRGSRFGERVGVVEVDKREAIDIDDAYDWWMAEKSLERRRVCFHVIGDRSVGLGHVHRALTLADRLIDHDVRFLCSTGSPLAAELIRARHHPVDIVAPGSEGPFLCEDRPDVVVNDVLDTEERFIRDLADAGMRTVNFEDLGTGSLACDAVINEMYEAHPRRDGRAFNGVSYCCLRDEFFSVFPKQQSDHVEEVLVLFGGTDPSRLTMRTLEWLDRLAGDFRVTVVAGLGLAETPELKRAAAKSEHPVEVVIDTPIISRYMARADLAITSAGRTVFELACLGVPMVVLAQNDREMTHTFASTSPGVRFLGRGTEVDAETFRAELEALLKDGARRAAMRKALLDADIRSGVDRVLAVLRDVLATTPSRRKVK